MEEDNRTKYADIIDLPYNGVRYHQHIPLLQRGAILAPFAALTGLDDELDSVARSVNTHPDQQLQPLETPDEQYPQDTIDPIYEDDFGI